jgi:hypothetical protein
MRHCSYCGQTGHNRITCVRRKESLIKAAENGNGYAKAELESKPRARTCSFCLLEGHDRRTCQELQDSVAEMGKINLDIRKEIHRRAKEHNFGVGSLVSFQVTNWVDGGYQKSEEFGIVQRIEWDRIGHSNEWDQSTDMYEPVVVQFATSIEASSRGNFERRFGFPFEIGYLGRKERSEFSPWRFDGEIKIVNGTRGDNEGESSLFDLTGCRKQAKQLFKDREWEHTYASRRIDAARELVDNFTY